ncbi:hypothetical protein SKAU_G00194450 [Synaphobranchus kaupii]|uniref:DDE Tnp4 domain-containing protein n=1 Tax=Synaphobranchus kaupii TaxID=118154 RepID=A0A9Q1IX75_SYNKA|nr:hypothetical protein SKAU_G00194450 [Synaphobranchus kaupii]
MESTSSDDDLVLLLLSRKRKKRSIWLAPHLKKQRNNFREPIDPEQPLAVCLRFISTGDSFTTIAASFRLGASTVAQIVRETCNAIWENMKEKYMPCPKLGPVPYVVVADEAFPMKPYLLQPYPGSRLQEDLRCAEGDQHPDGGEPYEVDGGDSILAPIRNLRGNRASAEALRVRETFHQYFVSPAGQVSWQYDHVHHGFSM